MAPRGGTRWTMCQASRCSVAPLFWIFYYKNRHTYLCANVGRHLKDGASPGPGSVLHTSPIVRPNIGQSITREAVGHLHSCHTANPHYNTRVIPLNPHCNLQIVRLHISLKFSRIFFSFRHIPCRLLIANREYRGNN